MAQQTYKSIVPATAQNRDQVYEALSIAMLHFVHLGVDLVSLSRDGQNFVLITVTGSIAPEQLAHLGMQ